MRKSTLQKIVDIVSKDTEKVNLIKRDFYNSINKIDYDVKTHQVEFYFTVEEIQKEYGETPEFLFQTISQLGFEIGFNRGELIYEDDKKENFKVVLRYEEEYFKEKYSTGSYCEKIFKRNSIYR